MKKQKEFISVRQAEEHKAKYEKLISGLKIPFLASIPITLVFWLMLGVDFEPSGAFQEFLWEALNAVAIILSPVAWGFAIFRGGLLVLKTVAKVAFWGFVIFVFPVNLLLGLVTLGLAIICCIAAPTIIFIAVWWQAKKEIAHAEEYIEYAVVVSE